VCTILHSVIFIHGTAPLVKELHQHRFLQASPIVSVFHFGIFPFPVYSDIDS